MSKRNGAVYTAPVPESLAGRAAGDTEEER